MARFLPARSGALDKLHVVEGTKLGRKSLRPPPGGIFHSNFSEQILLGAYG